MQNNLVWASLQNAAGEWVEPTLDGTTVAMQGVSLPDTMQVMLTNSTHPAAYPIAGFTWILVYADQTNAAKARTLAYFLSWALTQGQTFSADLFYAPLSPNAVEKAEALIHKITANGQPVLP